MTLKWKKKMKGETYVVVDMGMVTPLEG